MKLRINHDFRVINNNILISVIQCIRVPRHMERVTERAFQRSGLQREGRIAL